MSVTETMSSLDRVPARDAGDDRSRRLDLHLGVVARRRIRRMRSLGGVQQRLAGVLDEEPARRQRRDPDVFAAWALAGEDAARESIVEAVLARHPLLHRIDRFVLAQRHEQRVLALADLAAQPIADRFEVILRDVQPLVRLEEGRARRGRDRSRDRRRWAATGAASASAHPAYRRLASWSGDRMPMSSSDRSPRRFWVRARATTPGSWLGSSSVKAVFSSRCEASPAASRPMKRAPVQDRAGTAREPARGTG